MFGISILNFPVESSFPPINYQLFSGVELPAGMFSSHPPRLDIHHFKTIFFADLLPQNVTSEIVVQHPKIIHGFQKEMHRLLSEVAFHNGSAVTVDFGLEPCFIDQKRRNSLIRLLSLIASDLLSMKITLLLPVRVPYMDNVTPEHYLAFKRDTLCPNIQFSLEIHPHELAGRCIDINEHLHWLFFELRCVKFIYEPETGNRLTAKPLLIWLDFLKKNRFNGSVFFRPVTSRPEIFEHEIAYLEKLIPELKNSLEHKPKT